MSYPPVIPIGGDSGRSIIVAEMSMSIGAYPPKVAGRDIPIGGRSVSIGAYPP